MTQSHTTHEIGHDDAHGSCKGYMAGTVLLLASSGMLMGHVVPPGAALVALVWMSVFTFVYLRGML